MNNNFFNNLFLYIKQLKWFISLFFALLILLISKIYFIDIIKVNSKDMEPNFYYGDVLLINKMASTFKHGDCIWYKVHIDDSIQINTKCMQRLLGLPGDSLLIKEKQIYINGLLKEDSVPIKKNYILKTNKVWLDSIDFLNLKITEYQKISDYYDYSLSLENWQVDSVKLKHWFVHIEEKIEKPFNYDETCFPYNQIYAWNMDNYGSIYIPKKNDTIALTDSSIVLYRKIIEEFENNKLEVVNDSIFINKIYTNKYIIKQNYYFTLSDNRDNSIDCRQLGFIPESNIIGRVIYLIKRNK
jgi:signal peptidase I